jgi:hypothetical protein
LSETSLTFNEIDIHYLQPEEDSMKPIQWEQPKGLPYLIQRDDPISLIGRFPLDVDLFLKRAPLDGFKRNSSWNYRRENFRT